MHFAISTGVTVRYVARIEAMFMTAQQLVNYYTELAKCCTSSGAIFTRAYSSE
jgi:hypothetical protein